MTNYGNISRAARRLGFTSGLRRSKDVVRDNRSACEPSFINGRTNGKGSVDDVSPLPRHFLMPPMGIDESRPGLRSCCGGNDPCSKMGGKEMNVHGVAGYHREACVSVFKQHGRINPRLWCESTEWIAIIDPTTWDALNINDWQRIQMLMVCSRSIDGTIIGRCDEMLFRYGWNAGNPKREERYVDIVDMDPTVKTGLVVHALDIRTTESYMTMASVDLDDEGMPFWERHDGDYTVAMMIPLWGVGRMTKEERRKRRPTMKQAEAVCEQNEWLVTFLNKWENGID